MEIDDVESDTALLFALHPLQNSLGCVEPDKSVINVTVNEISYRVHQNPTLQRTGSGVTGAVVWSSTPIILEILLESSWFMYDLASATVLELGAGCGLAAMVLTPLCKAYIASDYDERILQLLAKNSPQSQVVQVDWLDDPKLHAHVVPEVSMILCLDCIYSSFLANALVKTLVSLNADTVVIGQQLRDQSVHLEFMHLCYEHYTIKRSGRDGYVLLRLTRR